MSDRAEQIIATGDVKKILSMAAGALIAAEQGRYCACEKPSLHGLDLMCGNCLLENKDQVRAKTRSIVEAHSFAPRGDSGIKARMCAQCSMWTDDPRHNGVPAVGKTPWGEEVRP